MEHLLCLCAGNWTYIHTERLPKINEQSPELKMQINVREYELLLAQKDLTHYTIYKKRRCFLWNNHYFQMDIYQDPCPPKYVPPPSAQCTSMRAVCVSLVLSYKGTPYASCQPYERLAARRSCSTIEVVM